MIYEEWESVRDKAGWTSTLTYPQDTKKVQEKIRRRIDEQIWIATEMHV